MSDWELDESTDKLVWCEHSVHWDNAVGLSSKLGLRRGFRRWRRVWGTKAQIYGAFEKFGRLKRGLRWFRSALLSKRVYNMRLKVLGRLVLRRWQEYLDNVPVKPVVHGFQAWVLFKWISLTLGNMDPSYAFDWRAVRSSVSKNRKAIHNESSRIRLYAIGRCRMLMKKLPLLFHALALLDAFLLRHCFWFLRKYTYERKVRTASLHNRIKKQFFFAWYSIAKVLKKERVLVRHVTNKRKYIVKDNLWLAWKIEYKCTSYHRWQCKQQKFHSVATWYRKAQSDKMQALLLRYGADCWKHQKCKMVIKQLLTRVHQRQLFSCSSDVSSTAGIVSQFLSKKHALAQWISYAQNRGQLRRCSATVCTIRAFKLEYNIFNMWRQSQVLNLRLRQTGNRLLCNRFRKILWCTWFAWRSQYQRLALIRANQTEDLKRQTEILKVRLAEYTAVKSCKTRKDALRGWSQLVRLRKLGKRVLTMWLRVGRLQLLKRYVLHWRTVNDVEVIVICVQKIWRGYYCRIRLKYRHIAQHLAWFRPRFSMARLVCRIRLLQQGFFLLYSHWRDRNGYRDDRCVVRKKRLVFSRLLQGIILKRSRDAICRSHLSMKWDRKLRSTFFLWMRKVPQWMRKKLALQCFSNTHKRRVFYKLKTRTYYLQRQQSEVVLFNRDLLSFALSRLVLWRNFHPMFALVDRVVDKHLKKRFFTKFEERRQMNLFISDNILMNMDMFNMRKYLRRLLWHNRRKFKDKDYWFRLRQHLPCRRITVHRKVTLSCLINRYEEPNVLARFAYWRRVTGRKVQCLGQLRELTRLRSIALQHLAVRHWARLARCFAVTCRRYQRASVYYVHKLLRIGLLRLKYFQWQHRKFSHRGFFPMSPRSHATYTDSSPTSSFSRPQSSPGYTMGHEALPSHQRNFSGPYYGVTSGNAQSPALNRVEESRWNVNSNVVHEDTSRFSPSNHSFDVSDSGNVQSVEDPFASSHYSPGYSPTATCNDELRNTNTTSLYDEYSCEQVSPDVRTEVMDAGNNTHYEEACQSSAQQLPFTLSSLSSPDHNTHLRLPPTSAAAQGLHTSMSASYRPSTSDTSTSQHGRQFRSRNQHAQSYIKVHQLPSSDHRTLDHSTWYSDICPLWGLQHGFKKWYKFARKQGKIRRRIERTFHFQVPGTQLQHAAPSLRYNSRMAPKFRFHPHNSHKGYSYSDTRMFATGATHFSRTSLTPRICEDVAICLFRAFSRLQHQTVHYLQTERRLSEYVCGTNKKKCARVMQQLTVDLKARRRKKRLLLRRQVLGRGSVSEVPYTMPLLITRLQQQLHQVFSSMKRDVQTYMIIENGKYRSSRHIIRYSKWGGFRKWISFHQSMTVSVSGQFGGQRHFRASWLRKALIRWWHYYRARKQFGKIIRRFYLIPALGQWVDNAALEMRHRRAVRYMRVTIMKRISETVLLTWRVYTTRSIRLRVSSDVVSRKKRFQLLDIYLCRWINVIDSGRDAVLTSTVQQLQRYYMVKRALISWHKCCLQWQLCTWKSVMVVWQQWKLYVYWQSRKRRQCESASCYYYCRIARRSLLKMRHRRAFSNYIHQLGVDTESCMLLRKLRSALRVSAAMGKGRRRKLPRIIMSHWFTWSHHQRHNRLAFIERLHTILAKHALVVTWSQWKVYIRQERSTHSLIAYVKSIRKSYIFLGWRQLLFDRTDQRARVRNVFGLRFKNVLLGEQYQLRLGFSRWHVAHILAPRINLPIIQSHVFKVWNKLLRSMRFYKASLRRKVLCHWRWYCRHKRHVRHRVIKIRKLIYTLDSIIRRPPVVLLEKAWRKWLLSTGVTRRKLTLGPKEANLTVWQQKIQNIRRQRG